MKILINLVLGALFFVISPSFSATSQEEAKTAFAELLPYFGLTSDEVSLEFASDYEAFTQGKRVVIGWQNLRRMSLDTLRLMLAHELTHVMHEDSRKHTRIQNWAVMSAALAQRSLNISSNSISQIESSMLQETLKAELIADETSARAVAVVFGHDPCETTVKIHMQFGAFYDPNPTHGSGAERSLRVCQKFGHPLVNFN